MRPWSRFLDLVTGTNEDDSHAEPGVVARLNAPIAREPGPEPTRHPMPRAQADYAPALRPDGTLSEARDWAPDSALASALASSIRYDPPGTVIPPPSALTYWRDYGFDTKTLSKASPVRLMEIMADISPDVSRALWDFLRFSIQGYEIKAYKPGTDGTVPSKPAQKALDAILKNLSDRNGTLDILFGRLFMGAFIRGAFFSERVFAKDNRTLLNIVTPDPVIVRFRRTTDPDTGEMFELGQLDTKGQFTPLDPERVLYLPIDPFPGSPYGRSPMNPAVFSVIFLISLLNDIKRVVAQQGYPRIDIEIDLKELAQILPPETAQDPDEFQRWVDATMASVKRTYAKLQPESAFVHTSLVKIHANVGTLDVNSLGMVGNIIERLERMAMKALKSMPLLMGSSDAMSDAAGNRAWEVYVDGIKNLQHHCENMLSRHLQAAVEAQGIAADVQVRFAELRTSELLRDEMTRQLTIANSLTEYLVGAVDFPTMVHNITGETPPDGVEEPLLIPSNYIAFGAANSTKNVNATGNPETATPDQAGGDPSAPDANAEGAKSKNPTVPAPKNTKKSPQGDVALSPRRDEDEPTNNVSVLVRREVETAMKRQLVAAAGMTSFNGNGHKPT